MIIANEIIITKANLTLESTSYGHARDIRTNPEVGFGRVRYKWTTAHPIAWRFYLAIHWRKWNRQRRKANRHDLGCKREERAVGAKGLKGKIYSRDCKQRSPLGMGRRKAYERDECVPRKGELEAEGWAFLGKTFCLFGGHTNAKAKHLRQISYDEKGHWTQNRDLPINIQWRIITRYIN